MNFLAYYNLSKIGGCSIIPNNLGGHEFECFHSFRRGQHSVVDILALTDGIF